MLREGHAFLGAQPSQVVGDEEVAWVVLVAHAPPISILGIQLI